MQRTIASLATLAGLRTTIPGLNHPNLIYLTLPDQI
jgi:hypothetical protein